MFRHIIAMAGNRRIADGNFRQMYEAASSYFVFCLAQPIRDSLCSGILS